MSGEAHGPQQKANLVFAAEILSKSHFFLLPFIFLNNLVAGMNSTALDGWQFNDNARSSWDIVWAAFTTIFACTWTIIHMPVPPRSLPESAITGRKFAGWFITFLAPELIAFGAASEFTAVRALIRRFNAAQARRDRETREPASWLYTRSKPLDVAAEWRDSSIKIYPPLPKWTLPQCFVVYMAGLTLETEDEWIFQVQPRIAHRLIDAGIIRCSDFESREIQGRAKTDGFAKAFAVLQSLWTLGNIIARAAYDLPITPLEFATLAYIVCAVITYALWWHKPQDITVPLAIHLRCTRSDLPAEVSSVTDHYPESWVHRRVIPTKWRLADLSVKLGTPVATDSGDGVAGETGVSLKTDLLVDNISGVGSLLFCGLHVIA
ncbi:hypothetical protein BJX66DRAFT_298187 [Aspergillus keveii]|uniref:Uncharacterized protein n=1 Tax=Aspergillus keveii TaxID=714993 RepID=A0ABR4GEM7_9EURO